MKPSTTPTSWHNRMHISREPTGYTGNTSISDRHVVVFLLPDIYIPSRKTCMLLSSCHILFYFVLIHSVSLLLSILYSFFFLRSVFIPVHQHQFRFLRKKREGGGNNGGSYDDITSSKGGKQEKKLSLLTLVSFTFYMRNTRKGKQERTHLGGRSSLNVASMPVLATISPVLSIGSYMKLGLFIGCCCRQGFFLSRFLIPSEGSWLAKEPVLVVVPLSK